VIERTIIDGRPAVVAYIGADGGDGGTVAPADAVLIKVRFTDDDGGIVFLDARPLPTAAENARIEAEKTLARLRRIERAKETLAHLRDPAPAPAPPAPAPARPSFRAALAKRNALARLTPEQHVEVALADQEKRKPKE
jgi:hypothetical protein